MSERCTHDPREALENQHIGGTMDPRQQALVHDLWDTLADFDAAQSDAALRYLMQELCALAAGCNVIWLGAVRLHPPLPEDPIGGWRVRNVQFLHASPLLDHTATEQVRLLEAGPVDITTIRNAAGAGAFRAHRLRDLIDDDWFASEYYRLYYWARGHADAVWVASPVSADAESWFGVFRGPHAEPFSTADRDVIACALRSLKWFQRQVMLAHGLQIATDALTEAERKVLYRLLTGLSEKAISGAIGRSYYTVHECVTSIFRKFGVNNRAALMALWLGRMPPN